MFFCHLRPSFMHPKKVEPAMDVTLMVWQLQYNHLPAHLAKHAGISRV